MLVSVCTSRIYKPQCTVQPKNDECAAYLEFYFNEKQITTITDTNNAKTILTTSKLVTSYEHDTCGIFLTTTGISILVLLENCLQTCMIYTSAECR